MDKDPTKKEGRYYCALTFPSVATCRSEMEIQQNASAKRANKLIKLVALTRGLLVARIRLVGADAIGHPAVGLAAIVGQPDAYAGEVPVGYVQLKSGASVAPGELEAWVRERTPERAAVPVQILQINPMPLTGVGKVFKPQLRWEAAARAFTAVLSPLQEKGIDCSVHVGPHGSHGSLATISVARVPEDKQPVVADELHKRLAPFVLRHEIVFK